jgi:hypothetical protein
MIAERSVEEIAKRWPSSTHSCPACSSWPRALRWSGSSDANEGPVVRSKFEIGAVSGSNSGLAAYASADFTLALRKR